MKKRTLLFILLHLTLFSAFSQHLEIPKTHWKSYGFQKQVEQVAIGYYKSDSLGYDPTMLEVYTFNKEGHLIQKYIRIFGAYESETAYNYVYNKGVLDSINTFASANMFNSKQKMNYNTQGKLASILASGAYTNFIDQMSYDKSGKIHSIERKFKNGGRKQTLFNTEKNYVLEKEIDSKGNIIENFFVYDDEEIFAFISGEDSTVTFYDAFHSTDFEIGVAKEPLSYTLKWRDLKQQDHEKYLEQISELQYNSTSKIILEIPVEATNEEGDWIKRLQIDKRYGNSNKQYVFKSLVYIDGTVSGSTEYDLIFEMKVSNIK